VALADELAYVSATELIARVRARQVSPLEVLDATSERIEARNPSLNAFVFQALDEARVEAREAQRRRERREAPKPLHGLPTATKDLYGHVPGWPATYGGIPSLRDHRPPQLSLWAERMQRAGALVLGKTNSPVLGFRGTTDNPLFGPTRNPFDPAHNSGGSSGGAAAAVADGLLAMAHASDGGGSIRIPASCCGLYGFKGSFGRVPLVGRPNAFGGASPFRFDGVLTRTVADAALAMTILAGPHARDPFSFTEPLDWLGALEDGVSGLRIAYTRDYRAYPIERAVTEVVERAVHAFEEGGARVEEIDLPPLPDQRELSDVWCRLVIPAHVAQLRALGAQGLDVAGELPPAHRRWLELAERLTVADTVRDQVLRTEVFDALTTVFGTYDLLVGPTLCCLPPRNADDGDTVGPSEIEGVTVDELIGWCPTYLANFTGHPAASVPAGLSGGLPVGMQIMGRRGADPDVIAASAAFERLRPWDYAIPAARDLSHA
jgi:amidase/aspartyl-tRNA(Asn)/glutamyl-tRNA(Gln) amidotransferase subunit A